MKREWMIGILAFILLSVSVSTGCGNNEAEMEKNDVKPVSVLKIREESRTITLHYTGTVEPENTRALSFKTSGKIAEIFVEEGQMVKNGDRLALLEQEDLSFSLAAAKAQMEGARIRRKCLLEPKAGGTYFHFLCRTFAYEDDY
jgi:HlyD family secretion protein